MQSDHDYTREKGILLRAFRSSWRLGAVALAAMLCAGRAEGQLISQRGFVEARGELFPQDAPNDPKQAVGDFLVREEVFAKPKSWLQLSAGVDLRASSHDLVADAWRLDLSDRGARRPPLSLRRAAATISYRRFTIDAGKQFIRWGKADIVNPTDRFAPRDFLNVLETDLVAVTGLRVAARLDDRNTVEAVWLPRFTPSRIPLLDTRWTAVPAETELRVIDAGAVLPSGPQTGIRWSHVGDRLEYSASFFDGFNHLPNIDAVVRPALPTLELPIATPAVDVTRMYPSIRSYGADLALPTPWVTVKGEAAYFTSSSPTTDEYVQYVAQVERQTGEWVLVAGYAGEYVTGRRAGLTFAPDRGLAGSVVGRASYTIDPNRSLAVETAVRHNLDGGYGKAEYSQAYGQHWRATLAGVVIRGEPDDFLGQYRRNSHMSIVLRYSF